MSPRQITILRICAEIIIAAAIGYFITFKSSWWDADAMIAFYWHPVLLPKLKRGGALASSRSHELFHIEFPAWLSFSH